MWRSKRDSCYNDYYREGSSSVAGMSATAGTAAIIVVISGGLLYCATKLVAEYGWQGVFNYIWEGDPYPVHIRQYLNDLQEMDETLNREQKNTLNRLEECLERAKLDTIDQADPGTIVAIWEQYVVASDNHNNNSTLQQTLQKLLAKLSYNLDHWVAKIDGIILIKDGEGAAVTDYLKQEKKNLSIRLVQMMERTDILVQFWKEGTVTTLAAAASSSNPTL